MPFSSEFHLCSLDTSRTELGDEFGDTPLVIREMSGVEGMNRLFRFDLDLLSNHRIPFDKVMGKQVTAVQVVGDGARWFHGIISELEYRGRYEAGESTPLESYRAILVPRLWIFTRNTNCRVWENKTVSQIIQEMFDQRFEDFTILDLKENHPVLEYTVQYYESDWNFLSRLMEEQGLGYYFRHDPDHDHLVIFDSSNDLPMLDEPFDTVRMGTAATASADEHEIDSLTVRQVLVPGATEMRGYDFTQPNNPLQMLSFSRIQIGGNDQYAIYDMPSNYDKPEGERFAVYRMEAEECASHLVEGQGCCAAFEPGSHFTLEGDYPSLFFDTKFLLTEVRHMLVQSVGHGSEDTRYENSFTVLPWSIPYRPTLDTEKPVVYGTETAVVVGPPEEEIKTDEWGRVRLQFHWDHEERKAEHRGKNVCWARVAQSMAGSGWGSIYIPRIGQEVVVTFIQGDPDRPMVTGVVYNGTHKVPYALDANKTQSGFKSRSSKGGSKANYNEIRFEDKKGSEQLLLHAERNMTTSVEADQALSVGNNRSVSIENDESITIAKGNQTLKVATGTRTTNIKGTDALTIEQGDHVVTVQGAKAGAALTVTTQNRQVDVAAGSYSVGAAQDVFLDGKAKFHAQGKSQATVFSPTKVVVTSDTEVSIAVGQSVIKLSAAGIELSAPKITSSAVGMHDITGALVKIN